MDYDIYKVGGILIQARKLLVCRKKDNPFFMGPGGKVERRETPRTALVRELQEEVCLTIGEDNLESFGTFYAQAANDESRVVRMDVFMVKTWVGNPKPGSEIEAIAWVRASDCTTKQIGSIFAHEVMPRLKEQGMID